MRYRHIDYQNFPHMVVLFCIGRIVKINDYLCLLQEWLNEENTLSNSLARFSDFNMNLSISFVNINYALANRIS
jgi:hypothetical protein